jgi:EAL domain-containing protein (putative c-di-GMP-specific phosphodiesterase class I)
MSADMINPDAAVEDSGDLARAGADTWYKSRHAAEFKDFRVFSAFQPIYSFSQQRRIGFEALVRGLDASSQAVAPLKLFSSMNIAEFVEFDKILNRIHLLNFQHLDLMDNLLFLNMSPDSLAAIGDRSSSFLELLVAADIPASRIVIEVLEWDTGETDQLERSVYRLRKMGCRIAVDDFGAGQSNLDRVRQLDPDIVKFDREMVHAAARDAGCRESMQGIVDLLHARKCEVLAEGIETQQQADCALEAGIDLGQGYLLARPFIVSESGSRVYALHGDTGDDYPGQSPFPGRENYWGVRE